MNKKKISIIKYNNFQLTHKRNNIRTVYLLKHQIEQNETKIDEKKISSSEIIYVNMNTHTHIHKMKMLRWKIKNHFTI